MLLAYDLRFANFEPFQTETVLSVVCSVEVGDGCGAEFAVVVDSDAWAECKRHVRNQDADSFGRLVNQFNANAPLIVKPDVSSFLSNSPVAATAIVKKC